MPAMIFTPLESTALDSYHYDAPTQRLTIRAKWGKEYGYDEVPQWVVDQFLKSKSKGHYHHALIRKFYSDKTTSTPPADDRFPDSPFPQD